MRLFSNYEILNRTRLK